MRPRTEAINRLRAAALHLDLRDLPSSLTTATARRELASRLATVRGGGAAADVLVGEMEDLLEDVGRLSARIDALDAQLVPLVTRRVPALLERRGVSTLVAAGLVGHAGRLADCRDASALAMRAGGAPVPCSGGRSQTLRLNAGGNRPLNRCLHVMATVQIRSASHPGRTSYERKRQEGKSRIVRPSARSRARWPRSSSTGCKPMREGAVRSHQGRLPHSP